LLSLCYIAHAYHCSGKTDFGVKIDKTVLYFNKTLKHKIKIFLILCNLQFEIGAGLYARPIHHCAMMPFLWLLSRRRMFGDDCRYWGNLVDMVNMVGSQRGSGTEPRVWVNPPTSHAEAGSFFAAQ